MLIKNVNEKFIANSARLKVTLGDAFVYKRARRLWNENTTAKRVLGFQLYVIQVAL